LELQLRTRARGRCRSRRRRLDWPHQIVVALDPDDVLLFRYLDSSTKPADMFARDVQHRPLAIEHSRRQLFEDRDLDIASELRLVLLPKL
jgi:hypothetical protein